MEFRKFILNKINKQRFAQIKNNDFFMLEVEVLKDKRLQQYYMHIIDNVSIDKNNTSNSYVMWIVNKVDVINMHESPKIEQPHISLPDIDTDIGVAFRDQLITYLSDRWGTDYVAQMITFGRLQGKAALKEVFRAQPETVQHLMKVDAVKHNKDPNDLNTRPFDLCNDITQCLPAENLISDELKIMREETGNDNIGVLQWAIVHVDTVAEAYNRFKVLFDQAIRLEGVKRNQSKHAAGLIISENPLSDLIPLTYDPKSSTRVCGVEMQDAEKMGAVKFDFLGVSALDKLWLGMQLVNKVKAKVTIDSQMEGTEE